jgi:hypothetical protein
MARDDTEGGASQKTQLINELHGAAVDFALVEMRLPVRQMARRSGLLEALGEDRIFNTISEAARTPVAFRGSRE